MAVDLTNVAQYNPLAVQHTVNFVFYVFLGVIACIFVGYMIYRIMKRFNYQYIVTFRMKVGNTTVQFQDRANRVKMNDNYYFHYLEKDVYSPIIAPIFFCLVKTSTYGIKQTKLGFTAVLDGVTVQPLLPEINGAYSVIDLDQFNLMQSRVKANHARFEKKTLFMQMLPLISVAIVIITFVLGMVFYTKHIETITGMMLEKAATESTKILDKATAFIQYTGTGQVIPKG